ncbi:MAG: hypothetical protein R3286_13530 [Gammaproteobacteria bacterium]|nr:hypothetical protein [Gammaproteobacteria bacterium]
MHESLVPVLAEFGAAMHVAQRLEYGLTLLLAFAAKYDEASISRAEVEDPFDRDAERTLGELFHRVRKKEYLTRAEQKIIRKAVKERNILVHRYLIDKGELMLTPEGRSELIGDIIRIRKNLQSADRIVESLVDRYLEEHDTTVDEITEQWDSLWVPDSAS